mmetsp:Transcript_18416/g.24314  ORF Transcript_18416/g.24314 Transcript_18416/m.24314 type:complete len:553 (+) Transcript_18416:122-1780(+)
MAARRHKCLSFTFTNLILILAVAYSLALGLKTERESLCTFHCKSKEFKTKGTRSRSRMKKDPIHIQLAPSVYVKDRSNPDYSTASPLNLTILTALSGGEDQGDQKGKQGLMSYLKKNSSAFYPYIALGSLALLYVHNQWTRSLIYYIVNFEVTATAKTATEFINIGLGFDENSYALLASLGFTLLYTISSLFAGRAADIFSRKKLAIFAATTWSTTTLLQGFARNFSQVFGLRVVTGLAQSFTSPTSYTFLADVFPPHRRALANSIYASGMYFGAGLASLSMLINSSFGWRGASKLIGSLGLGLAAFAMFILKEPVRKSTLPHTPQRKEHQNDSASLRLIDALKIVFSSKPVRAVYLAAALREAAGLGIYTWCAPFFRSKFPTNVTQYAVLNAAIMGCGGVISSFLGGFLSDYWMSQKGRHSGGRAWTCALGCLGAVPFWMLAVSSGNFYLAIGFLFLQYVVAEGWYGPTTAILQDALPSTVRGLAQGLLGMILTAGNISPVLIGIFANKNDASLQALLSQLIPLFYLLSSSIFYLTGRLIEKESTLVESSH